MKTRLMTFMHTRLRMLFKNRSTVAALAAVLLAFGLAGCGDSRRLHEDFDIVERVVTDHPDSALRILGKIARPERLGKPDRARYDLLMAEARYMADSIDTVPTRLIEAASFFDREEDSHNAARAYYYAGIQLLQKKDYGHAIVNFLKADKRTKRYDNSLLRGKIYRAIADCYEEVKDYKSYLHFHQLSYQEFRNAGIDEYIHDSSYDLARAFHDNEQYDSCIYYANKLYGHADSNLNSLALRLIATSYLDKKDYITAISKFDELQNSFPSQIQGKDYMNIGLAYLYNNHLDKAIEANNKALSMDSSLRLLDFRIATRTGDMNKAYDRLSQIAIYQYEWMDAIMYENYNALISDFHSQEEKEYQETISYERKSKTIIKIFAILGFGLLSAIILLIILKFRKERSIHLQKADILVQDLERMQSLIDNMSVEINRKDDDISDFKTRLETRDNEICRLGYDIRNLQQKNDDTEKELNVIMQQLGEERDNTSEKKRNIKALLNIHIKDIDRLLNKMYSSPSSSGKRELTKAEQNVSKLLKDPETLDLLVNSVNNVYDNIEVKFRNDFPSTTENEYNLFLGVVLGFSSATVSIILNAKIEAVYSRKNKLKTKIINSGSPNKEEYLVFF